MSSIIRRPVSLHTVWLHIDRLDRSDGRVWAVQWCDGRGQHYKAVHKVGTFAEGHTVLFGTAGAKEPGYLQPRAVVVFHDAAVRVIRTGKFWQAAIARAVHDRDRFAPTSSAIAVKRRARV